MVRWTSETMITDPSPYVGSHAEDWAFDGGCHCAWPNPCGCECGAPCGCRPSEAWRAQQDPAPVPVSCGYDPNHPPF